MTKFMNFYYSGCVPVFLENYKVIQTISKDIILRFG